MQRVNFRSQTKIAVNFSDEYDAPHIYTSFALSDGTILLVDSSNRCLKRLSPDDMSVTERLTIEGFPYGLLVFNETLVAVQLLFSQRFALVSVQTTMQLTSYINSYPRYTYLTKTLNPTSVKALKACQSDETETAHFISLTPYNKIHTSRTFGKVYVLCRNHKEQSNSLITVDAETGKNLRETKLNTSDLITDLCVDDCGTIFTLSNYRIQQFSNVGLKISETPLVNDCSPLSIDIVHSKMIVTYRHANYIDLISIEKIENSYSG